MYEILRDLFSGDMRNYQCECECQLTDEMYHVANELKETFTDKQKDLFKSFKTAQNNHEKELSYRNFISGFGLACKLIFEGLR